MREGFGVLGKRRVHIKHPTVLFHAACILFAAKTAPENTWAAQANLLGDRGQQCLEKALDFMERNRLRGSNIDASYRLLRRLYDDFMNCGPILPSLWIFVLTRFDCSSNSSFAHQPTRCRSSELQCRPWSKQLPLLRFWRYGLQQYGIQHSSAIECVQRKYVRVRCAVSAESATCLRANSIRNVAWRK